MYCFVQTQRNLEVVERDKHEQNFKTLQCP